MSKKRSVSYIKQREPEFLTRLKREAGYIEGPTVDTKKEILPNLSDDEYEDRTEEAPVVVVLKPGDLTQTEADELRKKQELGIFSLSLEWYKGMATLELLAVCPEPTTRRHCTDVL